MASFRWVALGAGLEDGCDVLVKIVLYQAGRYTATPIKYVYSWRYPLPKLSTSLWQLAQRTSARYLGIHTP